MRQFLAALLLLAGFASGVQADVAVPPLKARVTDLTGTLTAQQQGELEAKIAAYETRRGSQIAVLLLPTTKPEEIEQYSIRVAEAWKIGRKGVDDGLILVVAKDDRRLRIEVGYGLEGVIPDAAASRVINEYITPRFRNGDFYGGVRDGVDQLIKLAEGEKLPPPQVQPRGQAQPQGQAQPLGFFAHFLSSNPVVAFFLALVAGAVLKSIFGRLPGSLLTAVGAGIIALLLFGIGIALFAAIFAFLITYSNSGSGGGGYSGGSSSGGGWSSSGGSSSSSSSSSYSGGGGGSFGGGGSSGRW